MLLVRYRSGACMLAAVTRAACTTSGAPLEGPRCPEISRQAQYLRTFDIYCLSEQTTTRTAVVHVQADQEETGRIYVLSRFQKKRRPSRTHTQTHLAHTDMRTPPTSYYTDGTHFGFHDWIPTPQPQPHARTVGSDRHVVAASTVTVPGALLCAVCCVLCALCVLCVLCAPSCVLYDAVNESPRRWAVFLTQAQAL